jgi:hypothetical protein
MHAAIEWVAMNAESGSDDVESCTSAMVNDENEGHEHEVEESNGRLQIAYTCGLPPHEEATC